MKKLMLIALAILLALSYVVPASADYRRSDRSDRNDRNRNNHDRRGNAVVRFVRYPSRYAPTVIYVEPRYPPPPVVFDEPTYEAPVYLRRPSLPQVRVDRSSRRRSSLVGESKSKCFQEVMATPLQEGDPMTSADAMNYCNPNGRKSVRLSIQNTQNEPAPAPSPKPKKDITILCVRGELLCNGTQFDVGVLVDDQFAGTLKAGDAGPLANIPGWHPGAKLNAPVCPQ